MQTHTFAYMHPASVMDNLLGCCYISLLVLTNTLYDHFAIPHTHSMHMPYWHMRTSERATAKTSLNCFSDLFLFSCGFDAAQGDDEGFQLTPAGYGRLVHAVCYSYPYAACIVVLEGGYKPPIVAAGVRAVALALASTL